MKKPLLPLLALNILLSGAATARADDPAANVAKAQQSAAAEARERYNSKLADAAKKSEAHDSAGALREFEAALALAPTPEDKAETMRGIGSILLAQGKDEEARVQWNEELAMDGVSNDEKLSVRFLIGMSLMPKRPAEARKVFLALAEEPSVNAYSKLGMQFIAAGTYTSERNYVRAREEYARLLPKYEEQNDPSMTLTLRYRIAGTFLAEGKYAQALPLFTALVATKPDLEQPADMQQKMNGVIFQSRYGLADTYLHQGNTARAKQEYTAIVAASMPEEFKGDARKLLQMIEQKQKGK